MSNVDVILGAIAFQDFEVPEKIVFGGAQRVAVHELIGGGRVVDALGYDDAEISFAGVFSGSDAVARAQALDAMRSSGATVTLAWDRYFYTVIIAQFVADYEKPWWLPFALRCVVVADPAAEIESIVATTASLISADIAAAVLLAPQAGIGAISAAGLAATQTAIAGGIAASGIALGASGATLAGAPDALTGIGTVGQAVETSGQLAALAGMSGYVNRAAANVADALL
jgi:hypothetical protein